MQVNLPAIAAFPMYDFEHLEASHAALWAALRDRLTKGGVTGVPEHLTRGLHHEDIWTHPSLLLGQACEYPLAKNFARRVRIVATPHYSAPGCAGKTYRSAILVRKHDPAKILSDLRQRRCVINEPASNSGMNLFRATVAPLADGCAFFGSVLVSGSHRNSLQLLASGAADVLAVDCITWAHLQQLDPTLAGALRVLSWTAATPSLPFITSENTGERVVVALRCALADILADLRLREVRARLFIRGFDLQPGDFSEVLELESGAVNLGYPELV
jgi:ABC-type phosphate/phosphonate transport system substrate-binding protein